MTCIEIAFYIKQNLAFKCYAAHLKSNHNPFQNLCPIIQFQKKIFVCIKPIGLHFIFKKNFVKGQTEYTILTNIIIRYLILFFSISLNKLNPLIKTMYKIR